MGDNIFVGRKKELGMFTRRVVELLTSSRLANLGFFGPGGIGKTRLLAEMANIARTVTPYVVELNFDPAAANATHDPASLMRGGGLLPAGVGCF